VVNTVVMNIGVGITTIHGDHFDDASSLILGVVVAGAIRGGMLLENSAVRCSGLFAHRLVRFPPGGDGRFAGQRCRSRSFHC
jgi:hypothetical protein